MQLKYLENKTLENIANSIRGKTGSTGKLHYSEFKQEINKITEPNNTLSSYINKTITDIRAVDLDGLTFIGERIFKDYTSLESIVLPSGLTSIGEYAFEDCTSLESITFQNNTNCSIRQGAFNGCTSLSSITLSGSIAHHAFCDCTSLTTVILGASTISSNAFQGCTSLSSITIGGPGDPVGVSTIDSGAFSSINNRNRMTITIYTENGQSLLNDPWGATNATINYIDSTISN